MKEKRRIGTVEVKGTVDMDALLAALPKRSKSSCS